MNVQEEINRLRQNGFTVRCHHNRYFKNVAAVTPDGLDNILTSGEFFRAVEDNRLVYIEQFGDIVNTYDAEGDELIFGRQVSPTNGFTCVTIEKDGIVLGKGKHSFHNKPFNKRLGLLASFGKAIKSFEKALVEPT
jgi:hypothetical protein